MPRNLRKTLVHDFERGQSDRAELYPWQTDTCIGEWHYRQGIGYRQPAEVIAELVDIVSKNGNLLLNIPVRGDGSIDIGEVKFLEELAKWIEINGEAIYGTRPWIVPADARKQRGGIRYTAKGDTLLYAISIGWPATNALTLRSLALTAGATGKVAGVRLLGNPKKLAWTQDDKGLTIQLPSEKPCDHAYAFRISGKNLRGFNAEAVLAQASLIALAPDGSVTLEAADAECHGNSVRFENARGEGNLGFWDNPDDWVSWRIKALPAGRYALTALIAAARDDSEFIVEIGDCQLAGKPPKTKGWNDFQPLSLGTLEVGKTGDCTVKVRSRDAATWKAINLGWLKLHKAP